KRLAYFTFTHIGQEGLFEPDWTMIEAHGPVPTAIDIVFLSDDPFEAQYQMWSTSELRCYGDGVTGARTFAMAATAEEKELARQADAVGLRYFPIIDGCWTKDCPYSKPTEKNGKEFPSACRPHGRLVFQLIASPRLGSTAYFDTTGMRSISQIFSCLQAFKTATGAGNVEKGFVAGIPLTMVVRPYRTKKGTQYGVALEFRAETASQLKAQLVKHGVEFRMAAQLTDGPRMISPPVAGELEALTDDDEDEAARQSAEFYPQAQRSTAELVATKTEQATDALAARLSGGTPARASEREGAASVTAAAPAQTTPVTPSARTLASGAPPATEEFF
ncbi:MAG TPA: hypothetical protein VNW92_25325, partial [Polyangiaceae bacterium]|nr:hypothetical protein [Polyangiaceae bacterium]